MFTLGAVEMTGSGSGVSPPNKMQLVSCMDFPVTDSGCVGIGTDAAGNILRSATIVLWGYSAFDLHLDCCNVVRISDTIFKSVSPYSMSSTCRAYTIINLSKASSLQMQYSRYFA